MQIYPPCNIDELNHTHCPDNVVIFLKSGTLKHLFFIFMLIVKHQ